jgi:hypothetical protein
MFDMFDDTPVKEETLDELTDNEKEVLFAYINVIVKTEASLKETLHEMGLDFLYNEVEMPLVETLANIEANGMYVDKAKLKEFRTISDGGNDMRENFKFIKDYYKGKDKIDLLIIMSDFYDPLDGDTTTTSICPCLFMCIDHKDFKKPTKIKGEVYPFEVDKNK